MELYYGQNCLMRTNFFFIFFLSGTIISAQDKTYKIYHSDLFLNEIGTKWEISESDDGKYGYIFISDQHSFWNKLVLSFSMPKCDEPEVFIQIFTAAFRKHEGIIERGDLLNEARFVMQIDNEPPYWIDSEIRLISKFEDMVDKEFYEKFFKSKDLLFDIFFIEIKNGTTLIKKDDSLINKLSIFVPPESPYHLYLDGFNLLTFKNNEFQYAINKFINLCRKRQKENDLLTRATKVD